MFYAVDKKTGEIILSINMRDDKYNNSLRYLCYHCNDNYISFINLKYTIPHFRHFRNYYCSSSFKVFREFNIDFYNNWFKLFKNEYRKSYWYDINLEEISNENQIIMI
jgi:hypothetical protein